MVQADWNVVSIVAAAVGIVTALINCYIAYRIFRAREPVIEISVENLPPYQNESKKTKLTIKNVGTAGTTSDLKVIADLSWMPHTSLYFSLPEGRYILSPKESFSWNVPWPEPTPGSHTIQVTVSMAGKEWRCLETIER